MNKIFLTAFIALLLTACSSDNNNSSVSEEQSIQIPVSDVDNGETELKDLGDLVITESNGLELTWPVIAGVSSYSVTVTDSLSTIAHYSELTTNQLVISEPRIGQYLYFVEAFDQNNRLIAKSNLVPFNTESTEEAVLMDVAL